jgi:hypothetical protein
MFCVDGALTGREVVMSFAISALKTCFTLLNLLSMVNEEMIKLYH